MFERRSREDVLRMWLQAAEEFSQSATPHVGAFGIMTGQVSSHGEPREDLWFAVHVVEEITRARASTNPDKVDKVLLRSRTVTGSITGHSRNLVDECVKAGIITGDEDSKARLDAISDAIERRRRAIGLKGRGYFFD